MKINYIVFVILILLVSCNRGSDIIEYDNSEAFRLDQFFLKGKSKNIDLSWKITLVDTLSNEKILDDLLSLTDSITQFRKNRSKITLENCELTYNLLESKSIAFSPTQNGSWIEINAELLKITGKAKYAESLQKIFEEINNINNDDSLQCFLLKKIAPVIFTRNLDNVFLNIFTPSGVSFNHSLGGKVKIEQLTDDTSNGRCFLKFAMDDKRYMEIYIHIPEWAGDAHVEVKKVKYFTASGQYCVIAKKWKDGDIVEITLN